MLAMRRREAVRSNAEQIRNAFKVSEAMGPRPGLGQQ
jgi:hypothetical protein